MFTLQFVNLGYMSQEKFANLADALRYAKTKGFEAVIHHHGKIAASYSPLSGTQIFYHRITI